MTTITCDCCGRVGSVATDDLIVAFDSAEAAGWDCYPEKNVDYCPGCAQLDVFAKLRLRDEWEEIRKQLR